MRLGEQCLRRIEEDAGVPVISAFLKVSVGRHAVRLLHESRHIECTVIEGVGSLNIAVASFRSARFDPKGDDMIFRGVGGVGDGGAKTLWVGDHVIGGQKQDQSPWRMIFRPFGGHDRDACGVAPKRLQDHGSRLDAAGVQLIFRQLPMSMIANHEGRKKRHTVMSRKARGGILDH